MTDGNSPAPSSARDTPEQTIAGRLVRLARPLPAVAAVAWALSPAPARSPGNRSVALVTELGARGLRTAEASVHWVDAPPSALSPFHRVRALVRAHAGDEPSDLFLVRTRQTPEGALLGVDGVFNLTKTAAADESEPAVNGEHAAWLIGDGAKRYRVELADLGGEPAPTDADWTRLSKFERAIADWQRTGQLAGVGRRSFKLDPAARDVSLGFEASRLVVVADGHRIGIPFVASAPIEGERFVRQEDRTIARPGNFVTWAVDRARDSSLIGDERMQWTKAVVYAAFDAADRAKSAALPADSADLSEETGEAFGAGVAEATDPNTGFPPARLSALVEPPLDDEGVWHLLDNDPFVQVTPGAPCALATTYLRADGARSDSRVYVVAWDPRQVELDMVPGTEEPQTATGETGDGMIPRRPEVMSRVVAAFNGAFQSTHGDYGMQVDGALLVPPKPYAATIARTSDGAVGFGTWPYDLTIPKDFTSFRQNLTPLVADGKYNPYGREWWGGVPHDWEDETHTVRSGVCLMQGGFVAYFYGTQIDPVHLGRAMLAARCEYGLHLDMNQGHTGLELYRVAPAAELPPLPGKLDGHWQTEGDVPDMPGYRFRGRRLIKNLQLMHFPRYIRRGVRDYFYLTLKPILPGAPLAFGAGDADAEDGKWVVAALPEQGFPPALAVTNVRPEPTRPETKVRVLKIDPSLVEPATNDAAAAPLVTLAPAPSKTDGERLWLSNGRAKISNDDASGALIGAGSANGAHAVAAAGIDPDGTLVYAEVATARAPLGDGPLLEKVLGAAHCRAKIFFDAPLYVAIGGSRDLSDHPAARRTDGIRLIRRVAPRARRIFPETPVISPRDWQPLQRQTRFWPKPPAPDESSAAAPSGAPPAGEP